MALLWPTGCVAGVALNLAVSLATVASLLHHFIVRLMRLNGQTGCQCLFHWQQAWILHPAEQGMMLRLLFVRRADGCCCSLHDAVSAAASLPPAATRSGPLTLQRPPGSIMHSVLSHMVQSLLPWQHTLLLLSRTAVASLQVANSIPTQPAGGQFNYWQ